MRMARDFGRLDLHVICIIVMCVIGADSHSAQCALSSVCRCKLVLHIAKQNYY